MIQTTRTGLYRREHYNDIFNSMKDVFGDEWYAKVKPEQWVIWRKHLKGLFNEGILIREIQSVIGEADKKKWPQGTGFFARVRDLCLLQRKPEPTIRRDGMKSLREIYDHRRS